MYVIYGDSCGTIQYNIHHVYIDMACCTWLCMHTTRIHYSKYFQGQLLGSCSRHWEMAQAVAAVNDISVTYDILRLQ